MLPTSTDVTITNSSRIPAKVDAVVTFLVEGPRASNALVAEDRRAVERLIAAGVIRGKAKEIAFDIVGKGRREIGRAHV